MVGISTKLPLSAPNMLETIKLTSTGSGFFSGAGAATETVTGFSVSFSGDSIFSSVFFTAIRYKME